MCAHMCAHVRMSASMCMHMHIHVCAHMCTRVCVCMWRVRACARACVEGTRAAAAPGRAPGGSVRVCTGCGPRSRAWLQGGAPTLPAAASPSCSAGPWAAAALPGRPPLTPALASGPFPERLAGASPPWRLHLGPSLWPRPAGEGGPAARHTPATSLPLSALRAAGFGGQQEPDSRNRAPPRPAWGRGHAHTAGVKPVIVLGKAAAPSESSPCDAAASVVSGEGDSGGLWWELREEAAPGCQAPSTRLLTIDLSPDVPMCPSVRSHCQGTRLGPSCNDLARPWTQPRLLFKPAAA